MPKSHSGSKTKRSARQSSKSRLGSPTNYEKLVNVFTHQRNMAIKEVQHNSVAERQTIQKQYQQKMNDADAATKAALEKERDNELKLSADKESETIAAIDQRYQTNLQELQSQKAQREEEAKKLAATQNDLELAQQKYQKSSQQLEEQVMKSKEELHQSFVLIEQLKKERATLLTEFDRLAVKNAKQDEKLREFANERERLNAQLKNSQISATEYKEKLSKTMSAEQALIQDLKKSKISEAGVSTELEKLKAAIQQASAEMKQQKQENIALFKQFSEQSDSLQAVNIALDKCKSEAVSSEEVLRDMKERYESLRKNSEELIERMKSLTEQSSKDTQELVKVRDEKSKLVDELGAVQQVGKQLNDSLQDCHARNSKGLEETKVANSKIESLERELREALKALEREQLLKKQVEMFETNEKRSSQHRDELMNKISILDGENQMLQDKIQHFEEFKTQCVSDKALLTDLKKVSHQLQEEKKRLVEELEDTKNKYVEHREQVGKLSVALKECRDNIEKLKQKQADCLYPGQKQQYDLQIAELLRQKTNLTDRHAAVVREQSFAFQKLQQLSKENEDLKIIKQRYELEAGQVANMAASAAQLSVQLKDAKSIIQDKDAQLEQLATQVSILIGRIETLEKRENILQERLKTSVDAKDLMKSNDQIASCKVEYQRSQSKLEQLQKAANLLEEQQTLLKNKVKSLVDLLSDSERAKVQLAERVKSQNEMAEELTKCRDTRTGETSKLKDRIQVAEEQYREFVATHQKQMEEKNRQLKELQDRLNLANAREQTQLMERTPKPVHDIETTRAITPAKLPAGTESTKSSSPAAKTTPSPPTVPAKSVSQEGSSSLPVTMTTTPKVPSPEKPKPIVMTSPKNFSNQVQTQIEKVNTDIRKTENSSMSDMEKAKQLATLDSIEILQQLKAEHEKDIRRREAELSAIRHERYQDILRLLESNGTPSENPSKPLMLNGGSSILDEITKIQRESDDREESALRDMLELRAINKRLNSEYIAARTLQSKRLVNANNQLRQDIVDKSLAGAEATNLIGPVNSYTDMTIPHVNLLKSIRRDVQRNIDNGQDFLTDLERQQRAIAAIQQNFDRLPQPEIDRIRKRIMEDQRNLNKSADETKRILQLQKDKRSLLEDEVNNLISNVNQINQRLTDELKKPSELRNMKNVTSPVGDETAKVSRAFVDTAQSVGLKSSPYPKIESSFMNGDRHIRTFEMPMPGNRHSSSSDSAVSEVMINFIIDIFQKDELASEQQRKKAFKRLAHQISSRSLLRNRNSTPIVESLAAFTLSPDQAHIKLWKPENSFDDITDDQEYDSTKISVQCRNSDLENQVEKSMMQCAEKQKEGEYKNNALYFLFTVNLFSSRIHFLVCLFVQSDDESGLPSVLQSQFTSFLSEEFQKVKENNVRLIELSTDSDPNSPISNAINSAVSQFLEKISKSNV